MFSGTLLFFWWSNGYWQFDLWLLACISSLLLIYCFVEMCHNLLTHLPVDGHLVVFHFWPQRNDQLTNRDCHGCRKTFQFWGKRKLSLSILAAVTRIDSRNLLLTVQEAGGLRSECQMVRGGLIPGSEHLCLFTWWEGWGALWGLFYEGTNPICKGCTLMT